MKKYVYITLFTLLGFLVQLLIHVIIEQWYINFLLSDFSTFGFGWSWDMWFLIHHSLTIILTILGILLGLWQGRYWWQRLYEK